MAYDREKARLERALRRKKLNKAVRVCRPLHGHREIDAEFILQFPDGRQAFGSFDELITRIEQADNVDLLMALCDLDEQLAD